MRIALTVAVLALAVAGPAAAAPDAHVCGNVDRHGAFGIFAVTSQGAACRPARRLARRWLHWAGRAAPP